MDTLGFRSEGEGQRVLVIHGWEVAGWVEALDLEPVFTAKPGYQRLYVDLPGHGNSPSNGERNLDAMFERLVNFVEQNIVPQKFLVIGSSCGAYFARALAYRYQDLVLGLLLRVPLVEPTTAKRDVDPIQPAIANQALLDKLPGPLLGKLEDIAVQIPEYVAALSTKYEEAWLPAAAAADHAILDPIRNDPARYCLTFPMHSPTNPFTKPTLVITGRQDTSVGYRDAWSLLPSYPRASFVLLDRGDHGLPVDQGVLFQALVIEWLDRVAESMKHVSAGA